MLELWRNKIPGGTLQFYRTTDGIEVDFVLSQMKDVLAIECKYKNLQKPVSNASLNNFCLDESIGKRVYVTRNLNTSQDGAKLIQGFLVNRVFIYNE